MTSNAMQQLYQQIILDHARTRSGYGLLEEFEGESFQRNVVCGDEATVRVHLTDGDQGTRQLAALGWEGQGCSISQASLSAMHQVVQGRSLEEVARLEEYFTELMHSQGKGIEEAKADALGDASALEGVSIFPARVKCALLGWAALRDAVLKAQAHHQDQTDQEEGERP